MKQTKKMALDLLGSNKLLELYKEEKTLTNLALKQKVSIETLRQYFIKNNIQYDKQVVYDVDHNFFTEDNEKSFYWSGFHSADLGIEKDKPRMKLSLATKDKRHIEKFKQDTKSNAPIRDYVTIDNRPAFKSKIYYGSTIAITSRQMIKDLARFNVVPQKTYTYTIPDWIEGHPLCHHFLRGLIDGDGWIRRSAIGLCGTKACIQKAINIISKHCNIDISEFHFKECKPTLSQFNVHKKPLIKIVIDYLYKDAITYLDRKHVVAKWCSENGKYVDIKHHLNFDNIDISANSKDIAKTLNTSAATVRRRLDEMGLKPVEHRHEYNGCFDNECEEKYYWLGFLFNHSSFYKKKYRVSITFRMRDVIEKLQKFTNYYNCNIFETRTGFRLTISSEEIYKKLIEFGIDKKETIIQPIVNSKYLHHFIRGLVDAKSSIDTDNRLALTISNEASDQFRQILTDEAKLNIASKNTITLRMRNIILLRNYMYRDANIYIKVKRNRLLSV